MTLTVTAEWDEDKDGDQTEAVVATLGWALRDVPGWYVEQGVNWGTYRINDVDLRQDDIWYEIWGHGPKKDNSGWDDPTASTADWED